MTVPQGNRGWGVARPKKSVSVPRREASLYLAKARQLLEEAQVALQGSRLDSAMLNSIHAGINATDAVTVALAGRRSTDSDHQRAADLLEEVGPRSEAIADRAKQLRALLAKKNQVEYESRRATAKEAAEAVSRAERIVRSAMQIVASARL